MLLGLVGCGQVDAHRAVSENCVDAERPGPWSTWPEAKWVRRIVEEGGYRVIGATGSAIVAHGNGHEFYLWAAELPIETQTDRGDWRKLTTIGDVVVYGDEDLWRTWAAQGFTFWIQAGPMASSVPPPPRQLASLIKASLHVQLPELCAPPPPEPEEASRVESRTP